MPCKPGISVPLPELPSPLSVNPPIPTPPNIVPELCCTLPPIPKPKKIPPIPPIAVNQGIVSVLENALDQVLDYLDKIPLKCPKEL